MQYSEYGLTEDQRALRAGVRELCAKFPETYWAELDEKVEYPHDFINALTEGGYLAALIPEEFGGLGLGIMEGCLILEEIHRCGDSAWS